MTWQDLFTQVADVPAEKLRWWLSDRLDCSLTSLPMTECPDAELRGDFEAAAERLRRGEPVQYVCGRAPFRDVELMVDERVLIPRPETEQLVQIALAEVIRPGDRVLDVGTGSGCIALSVKKARPDCVVEGRDVSTDALEVAGENARRLGLKVTFAPGHLCKQETDGSWDVILANLPYIGERERSDLPSEVSEFEPGLALFSGADGTDLVLELMGDARRVLRPSGTLQLETGENQGHLYRAAAGKLGWVIEGRSDLAGRERFWLLRFQTGFSHKGAKNTKRLGL
ncbi:MAG: peptide chain release factor N(5)-glutamine methyltransferase [Kiritimatiellae bacterium]|jgi:release factor glutamine methyltransferase|nr:peptide chain release factor N(5)-glutamine methyltransferase [Kiritimatiellia bacterium]